MAFVQCESLIGFTVADGNENYKAIDGNLYNKDGKTLVQYAIGKTETTFTIPEDVTTMAYGALAFNANLKSIKMGDNVKNITELAACACPSLEYVIIGSGVEFIGSWAFSGCDKLAAVYYHGTEEAWKAVGRESYDDGYEWDYTATVYFYSETNPETEGNFWHYDSDGKPAIWN